MLMVHLILWRIHFIRNTLNVNFMATIKICLQRNRPGRSGERERVRRVESGLQMHYDFFYMFNDIYS